MANAVALHPHEPGEAPELHAAIHESRHELAPWMPWCHPGYSLEEAAAWIELARAGYRDGSIYDFTIRVDGQIAGACGINRIDALTRVGNLGYWVRSSRAGAGIAPRAVGLLLDWVFENTELNRLEIVVAVDNVRSQRVAEKVGARREAVLAERAIAHGRPTDAIMYCVLRGGDR